MHLYSDLQSFLEVHVMSTCCYSECFHLDESTSKFPLLAAAYLFWSLCRHFGREFLTSIPALPRKLMLSICGLRGELFSLSLSLSPALIGVLLSLSLGGLANFFQLHLFFCPPTVVYKINQRQIYHTKYDLCQVLHKSAKCLRGENIEDGCD